MKARADPAAQVDVAGPRPRTRGSETAWLVRHIIPSEIQCAFCHHKRKNAW
jgi:hypothetical protein